MSTIASPIMMNSSKNLPEVEIKKCMQPMHDYNQNSSYQATVNDKANQLLLKSAKKISKLYQGDYKIADFGCSHGKNSMVCFKAAFDGIEFEPEHEPTITAYFNDLPTNDFDQVLDLLKDKSQSITEHTLFKEKGGNLSTLINGKSFYSRCFPKEHLHLGFSFFCLHWMSTSRSLSNSIVTKSESVTHSEAKQLALDASLELNRFLSYRAIEMKTGGHLIITLPKDSNMQNWIDILWKRYLKQNGYTHNQFSEVFIPAYHRSDVEIQSALDEMSSVWKPVIRTIHNNHGASFTPAILRAATFNLVLNGVVASKMFPNLDSASDFTEGFYNSLGSDWDNVYNATHMLVLERI